MTAVKLCIQVLMEVVDSGAKNMEICVVRSNGVKHFMKEHKIDAIVKEIESKIEESKKKIHPRKLMILCKILHI